MYEHDLIVCITSFKSGPLFFKEISATIDFTVLCVIGLSLRIIVTGPIYCLEGGKESMCLCLNHLRATVL